MQKNEDQNKLASAWKRLKGKNPEGKNFRKLLRRKQPSAKIAKIYSKYSKFQCKSDIFNLLRDLLKYLPRTFFLPRSFQNFFPLRFYPLALSDLRNLGLEAGFDCVSKLARASQHKSRYSRYQCIVTIGGLATEHYAVVIHYFFSLRSCRSSSVIFFLISRWKC